MAESNPWHTSPEETLGENDVFQIDINRKMKVPEKISFSNDMNGELISPWVRDNFAMQVPERILVMGQDQHVGTRAPPREIAFDNSFLASSDTFTDNLPRVATPPRNLTLDKYPFPGIEDYQQNYAYPEDQLPVVNPKAKVQLNLNDSIYSMSNSFRETATPPMGGGESLTPAEEVIHLRRQLAKLNRRVLTLELENINRLQKEKILLGFGMAYFLLKVIIWMNRD